MNKEWSELNKAMQSQLKKASFNQGIETLLTLRSELMAQIKEFQDTLTEEQFCAIPFLNADGYHSKTIAYSIYHIFRIEDIVAHTVINKDEEIFFAGNYKERMKSPIITTGNELVKQEIADFSKQLDIEALYQYISEVDASSTALLKGLIYEDLKTQFGEAEKQAIHELQVVDASADWLTDYWCEKNIKGLLQMPFSRHWIMHVEASLRIQNKICK